MAEREFRSEEEEKKQGNNNCVNKDMRFAFAFVSNLPSIVVRRAKIPIYNGKSCVVEMVHTIVVLGGGRGDHPHPPH